MLRAPYARALGPGLLAFATLLLVAAPTVLGAYWLRELTGVFMYAVIAQGMNLIAGYTGYPAFGNVVFFGIGAYVTGVLMTQLNMSFWLALAINGCVCLLTVLVIGPPLLRLKGHYFAIATLGLNEFFREIVGTMDNLTGGGSGLSLPMTPWMPAVSAKMFYLLFLGSMILSTWAVWEFSRRRLGLYCKAIRDDETKARAMGIRTLRCKLAAWMISAVLTGLAGSLDAYWITFISPSSTFDLGMAVEAFVILLLGGAGTVLGPVFGAFFVESLATLTWTHLLNWHLGVMGLIIIGVIVLFPDGWRQALFTGPRDG